MSQFDELLKSLQATADEQDDGAAGGADDETIEAAAADAGVAGDGNPEGDADAGADDKKPVMAKSTTAEGEAGEVIDATEILKSLQAGQEEQAGVLAKALTAMTGALQKQGEVIKSLRAEVRTLSAQGRGRKAVVSVAEKPSIMAKSTTAEGEGLKPQEVMAKCLDAQRNGKLTSLDVARAEISIQHGVPIPAEILRTIQ